MLVISLFWSSKVLRCFSAAIVFIEVLSTFGNPNNAYVYFLIDTGMNTPRILALGIVIGYLYKRLYSSGVAKK
jgi:hypothetical protein